MSHGHWPASSSTPQHPTGGADDEYLEKPGSSYEHTDADAWLTAKFGIWLLITAVVVHFGIGLMFKLLAEQTRSTQTQQYPLATASEPRLPAAPRLQQFPRSEMYEFRLQEDAKLNSYGWVNKDAGTVHIPIADAMKLALERGIYQSRPDDGTLPTPGLLASDSSSGRVYERRRQ